jgi:hypothetical protein
MTAGLKDNTRRVKDYTARVDVVPGPLKVMRSRNIAAPV